MTKSKIPLGKFHIPLENMKVIFKSLLILILNSTVIREQTLYDFKSFRLCNFCILFYVPDYVSGFYGL